jgi:osmoprotectant transport system permease protein
VSLVDATLAWLTNPVNWQGPNGVPTRLVEHLALSLAALVLAAAVALPAGLAIGHAHRGSGLAVGLGTIGRAIPSFALMGLIIPITQSLDPENGFKVYPTLLAMAILAIPPILVNTLTGVAEVDQDLVEAARGMGFREGELLRRIEIPLALPVILGGIRSATVQVIATTTLGAILAYGGLGRYIVDGIAIQDDGELYGGVVLVATLAVLGEGVLALLQRLAARQSGAFGKAPDVEPPAGATAARDLAGSVKPA